MIMEVETVVAVALMMAVFSAVAAVGTSIVLGAGFERLRAGFDVVKKQTGFFSDAIYRLEQKVQVVDQQAGQFGQTIHALESKVSNVGEQANLFCDSIQKLEQKVEIVDRQTGFFSDALHRLEQKVEAVHTQEDIVQEKIRAHADHDLISTGKAEVLLSHAENLLTQVSSLTAQLQDRPPQHPSEVRTLSIPQNLAHFVVSADESKEIRFH